MNERLQGLIIFFYFIGGAVASFWFWAQDHIPEWYYSPAIIVIGGIFYILLIKSEKREDLF